MRRIVMFAINDFTLGKAGSHVRMAELAGFLEQQFDDAIVYGLVEHPDDPWDEAAQERFARQYPGLTLVLDHRTQVSECYAKFKSNALALAPGRARSILGWHHKGSTPNWAKIRDNPDDYLPLTNWVDGAIWLNGMGKGPFWIESHDVKFLKHAKKTGAAVHEFAASQRLRSEAAVLSAASAIVSISPVDQAILSALSPANPNFYIPSYNSDYAPLAPDRAAAMAHDVLFVGSGNSFNVDGLSRFIAEHGPWLETVRFAIAGQVSENAQTRAALQHVPSAKVLGFVDHLGDLYASSKVVISPVDGTGLKIKVVEALRHGKPVFASRHSRDGLPGAYEKCVFALEPALIDAMLADDGKLSAAMAAAQDYCHTLNNAGDREAMLAALKAQVAG